jgi:hypothetical protein
MRLFALAFAEIVNPCVLELNDAQMLGLRAHTTRKHTKG